LPTKRNPIRNPCQELPSDKTGGKFRRQEHLKRRVDITGVFKKGRTVSCLGYRLFYRANELSYNRIAISFVRKFGNAVQRNRARRLGREAYRLMKNELKNGFDFILLVYPQKTENSRGSLSESAGYLKTLFEKAGIC
jgi:ribonuclease P protein component